MNVVAPGPIDTPIYKKTGRSEEFVDNYKAHLLAINPMKRFGKPEEVAGAVAFLASQDASLHHWRGDQRGRRSGADLRPAGG